MDRSPNFVRTHTHILIKSRTRLVSTPHYEDLPPTRTNGALPSIPRCTTRDGRSPREVPLAVCVVVVRRASSSSERTHDTTRARTFPRIRTSRATARRVVARTTRTRARATPKGTRTHRHRIVPSASSIVLVVLVTSSSSSRLHLPLVIRSRIYYANQNTHARRHTHVVVVVVVVATRQTARDHAHVGRVCNEIARSLARVWRVARARPSNARARPRTLRPVRCDLVFPYRTSRETYLCVRRDATRRDAGRAPDVRSLWGLYFIRSTTPSAVRVGFSRARGRASDTRTAEDGVDRPIVTRCACDDDDDARADREKINRVGRRACPSMGGPARGVANGRWRWRSFRDLVGRPVVRRDEALTRQGSDGRVGVCRLDGRVGARGRVTPDVRIPCPSVRPSVRPSP